MKHHGIVRILCTPKAVTSRHGKENGTSKAVRKPRVTQVLRKQSCCVIGWFLTNIGWFLT